MLALIALFMPGVITALLYCRHKKKLYGKEIMKRILFHIIWINVIIYIGMWFIGMRNFSLFEMGMRFKIKWFLLGTALGIMPEVMPGIVNLVKHFRKRRALFKNSMVLLFYTAITVIFNWSLLCGKNIMKWDIMDAYYPLCMSSADMLMKGKLPLWNAAFNFGTPTYIMLGIPYWYPTTILFELTSGYALICVALEYCIHIVLACFGMFLLTKSYLHYAEENKRFIIAASMGLFYGFSGMFLSNAEHIMIIVSAVWIPYVLLFVKKYLENDHKIFLMAASFCLGLSILGGYPDVWIATLITLIPYFVLHTKSEDKVMVKLFKAAGKYLLFVAGAFSVSAISVIPFIMSSKYISRLKGGMTSVSYTLHMMLSGILPHYSSFKNAFENSIDISMISMFMGILTLLLFVFSFFVKIKNRWTYLGFICFAFLMMLGDHAFLYPIFYKYFPLFSSLRFPPTWRGIMTVFALLLAAETLEAVTGNERKFKIFIPVCFLIGILFYISYSILPSIFGDILSGEMISAFQSDLKGDCVVSLIYALIFALIFIIREIKKKDITGILLAGVVIDIFVGQTFLHHATVTEIDQWNAQAMKEGQESMQGKFDVDQARSHSIEYKDAERTRKGLNSYEIILEHTLDEEGYLSVSLDYINKYRDSEHCKIASEIPAAYFTNNVISKEEVDYDEWLQDTTVSPYQIYVEQKEDDFETEPLLEENLAAESFTSGNIFFKTNQDLKGYLVVQQSYYPGWRVYVDGKKEKPVQINGAFLGVYLDEGVHEVNFVFRPVDFCIGAIISLLFVLMFVCEYIRFYKESRKITVLE